MTNERTGRSLLTFAMASAFLLLPTLATMGACSGSDTQTGATSSSSSGSGGAGGGGFLDTSASSTGSGVTCTVPCDTGQICSHGTCVKQGTCTSDNDCENDTFCDKASGLCQPWGPPSPGHDPKCIQASVPGVLAPKVKCEFSTAPPGDPFPNHVDVQSTPVVVRFSTDATVSPSIAASFTATVVGGYTEDLGVIRVLRGDNCQLEANLGGTDLDNDGAIDWTVSSATLAVGDLDGDKVAEIVAYGADGSTLAFTKKNNAWSLLWKAPLPTGAPWTPCDPTSHGCPIGWAGPSIHDIDDDGVPEVIREGVVFNANGSLKSLQPPLYASYSQGLPPVLANLDQDPRIEITNGQYVWEWNAGAWVQEPGFPGASASAPGFTAVADFGAFGQNVPSKNPEIAVVRNNAVMVYAIDGSLAMPPVPVPGAGGGGPPTISDFDGDGLPEVGVAGQAFYTVYDIDCGPNPRPGGQCALGPCDYLGATCAANGYVLWSRSTQDLSSNITGSSIFDFEADGKSEVVYADECFTRVYSGVTGEVLFSQYRSSCTWLENPVVADTDGNFRADLVTPSNKACSPTGDGIACSTLNADGVDAQFNGLHCKGNSDCKSNVCDQGLCRCNAGADCCAGGTDALCLEAGYKCSPPNPGTPGTGNTCRAAHPHGVSGIRVYSDANDAWVRSRTIWSQHAYAVTHINEDGTVPKTSLWMNNWDDPTLNNFRQNVPGDPNGNALPDTTAGASAFMTCNGASASLEVDICNRGASPVGAGIVVGFYVNMAQVCQTTTTMPLAPEECQHVSCVWDSPPTSMDMAVDVNVVANDGDAVNECKTGNDQGTVQGVFCKPPS